MELRLCCRRSGESLAGLHQDIRCLIVLSHPKFPSEARDVIACNYFIDALDDPDMALKVQQWALKSLDEALHLALRLEAWAKDARRQSTETDVRKPPERGTARGVESGARSSSTDVEEKLASIIQKGLTKCLRELRNSGNTTARRLYRETFYFVACFCGVLATLYIRCLYSHFRHLFIV